MPYAKSAKKYECECIDCGYIEESDKHCKDIKCPKCGGQMRRKERPGPGQQAGKKEKQSMTEDTAPTKACIFNDSAIVAFSEDDEKNNNFRIVGYSGGIIKDHWFWGDVAFDLSGVKFAKKRIPILEEHFTFKRIGFSTKQEISDKVIVEGQFLENEDAQKIRADIKAGFPMEASVYIVPSSIEYVKDKKNANVNGKNLEGPGTIFRKAVVKEVSMCVFGADSNTNSSASDDNDNQKIKFNLIQENNIMAKETQTVIEIKSAEGFAELYPGLHEEILAQGMSEGKKEERDLFAALKDACGGDNELLVQCYSEGKTAAEAMKLRVDKIEAEKTQLTEKVTELEKKKKPVDPANAEFTDEASATGKFDEKKATDEQLKEHFNQTQELKDQYSSADAYIAAIRHPAK